MSDSEKQNSNDKPAFKFEEETPVITQHEQKIGGKKIAYTATVGRMPLKTEQDEIDAQIFFIAYTRDDVKDHSQRPLVFAFNGGPGSASIWLHMGALGPKRVDMADGGFLPASPYRMTDNEYSILDLADIVFVDPVGTGFSRAKDDDTAKTFWNLEKDVESVGKFIRLYLTRYGRWSSPLFLAGESYGTTRSAGLAGHLVDKGITFAGILLVSTVLNFQTILFGRGNDLPYMLYIPTYAATAWYHQRLPEDLQTRPLADVLAEVEAWTVSDYWVALARGDQLPEDERQSIISTLSRYTGLSEQYLAYTNLRPEIMRFDKELLRDEGWTVGRIDSRFKGRDAVQVNERPDFDPSLVQIDPPYTAVFNQYVRQHLGYETDLEYMTLSYDVNGKWEWERGRYPDTSEALRSALAKNPYTQIYIGQGYYDLATPHYGAVYTFNHMDLSPEARQNLHFYFYEAGHMYYLDVPSLKQFKADAKKFFKAALNQ